MAEGETFEQMVKRERWCMEKVPPGEEKWPKGASWHPLQGVCKARGKVKVKDEWRCKKHAPPEAP